MSNGNKCTETGTKGSATKEGSVNTFETKRNADKKEQGIQYNIPEVCITGTQSKDKPGVQPSVIMH